MKFKRIYTLFLVFVLLLSMLPAAYATQVDETVPDSEETGAVEPTTDTTEPSELVEPEGSEPTEPESDFAVGESDEEPATTYGLRNSAFLRNCDQMAFLCTDNTRQGFHFADEDGGAPWDYMNMIYCLENKKSFSYGDGHAGVDNLPLDGSGTTHGEKVWYNFSPDQRVAIALVMLYGAPTKLWDYSWGINATGDWNKHNPNIGYRFATQAIIWEIVQGMREPLPPYERTKDYWYAKSVGVCMSEDGTVDHFVVAYDSIIRDMQLHNTIPSFAGDFAATAPEIELTDSTITVTDTNGVLPRFDFVDTDTVSYSKDGNDLTITATGEIPTSIQSATATLPNPEASLYQVWYNQYDSSKQVCIQVSIPASDPVPAYFKLKASTGNLSIEKTTEDGQNLEGWQFALYTQETCEQMISGPYTTDAEGKLTVTGLKPGAVWVKEIGHVDPAIDSRYVCDDTNPQEAIIRSGQTAIVSFHNRLRYGNIRIIKSMPDGGSAQGWTFAVCRKSDYAVVGRYTTQGNSTIAEGLLPGDYLVYENIPDSSIYYCESNNPQQVTVVEGQTAEVTFTNRLKPAQIQLRKTNTVGKTLSGVTFALEWSEDGITWKPVKYTDSPYVTKGTCTSTGLHGNKLTTDASGTLTFTGLHPLMQYRLTEVETKEGYQLLTDYAYQGGIPQDSLAVSLKVVNVPAFELPNTGGNSFAHMTMGLIVCAAFTLGALYVLKRKATT